MSNVSTKKQNRILLAALVVILAFTAILIAITGSANKKEKTDTPPLGNGNSVTEKDSKNSDDKSAGDKSIGTGIHSKDDGESEDINENLPKNGESDKNSVKPGDKDAKTDAESNEDINVNSGENANSAEVSALENGTLPTFASPVNAPVLKDFSGRIPVFSYTMNDYRVHSGLDFVASKGTPVCAAADGEVFEIVDDPMMGVCVSIRHSGGAVTKYKGLSEESMSVCAPGEAVKCGQVIGSAGDTALIESAEENHVHFELSVDGENKNPADYFKVSYVSDLHED